MLTDMALGVNAAHAGLQVGRHLNDPHTHSAEAPLLVACAFVRVASLVLVYNGLLSISAHLENPLGDNPADLPALAYQVWMKKECESFGAHRPRLATACARLTVRSLTRVIARSHARLIARPARAAHSTVQNPTTTSMCGARGVGMGFQIGGARVASLRTLRTPGALGALWVPSETANRQASQS